MASPLKITFEMADRLFYEEDGILYHKTDKSHNAAIGDEAGHVNASGYKHVKIKDAKYQVHRLLYVLYTGEEIPEGYVIDHIDRNKLNNKRENLRLVTQSENCYNRTAKGYYKVGKKYAARIMVKGKRVKLGNYDKKEDAHKAYLEAKEKYHAIEER